jgi:uncharacterized membrane protein
MRKLYKSRIADPFGKKGNLMTNLWGYIKIRVQSWPMWIAFGSLAVFVTMQVTGTDISTPVNTMLALFLPVLCGFGIVNDPAVRDRLMANGEQKWYQSKAMWVAMSALLSYVVKLIFGTDINSTISGLLDVILPILISAGVVISPTAGNTTTSAS